MRLTDPIKLPSSVMLLVSILLLLTSAFSVLMLSLVPGLILHAIVGNYFCPAYEAGESESLMRFLMCKWGSGWREMIGEFPYDFSIGFCLIFWVTAVESKYSRWVGLSLLILFNLIIAYIVGWNFNSLLRLVMVFLGGIMGLYIGSFQERKRITSKLP